MCMGNGDIEKRISMVIVNSRSTIPRQMSLVPSDLLPFSL